MFLHTNFYLVKTSHNRDVISNNFFRLKVRVKQRNRNNLFSPTKYGGGMREFSMKTDSWFHLTREYIKFSFQE